MVFKCSKGTFQLVKNYRDAFKEEAFEEKYLEECFDKDMYIVGDIASEILRLKGFDTDPKSKNYYGFIDDYLDISCAFGCPHFILKRIKNEEEAKKAENIPVITEDDRVQMKSITKENFDKESLILKTSQKVKPHIVIDPKKMNAIPKGELPDDLKDDVRDVPKKNPSEPEKPVVVETFVSSSEDFDPSKKQDRFRNRNNNRPQKEKKDNSNSPKAQNALKENNNGNNNNNKPKQNNNNKPKQNNNNNNNNRPKMQQDASKNESVNAEGNKEKEANNGGNRNFHGHRRNRGHGDNRKPDAEGGNK